MAISVMLLGRPPARQVETIGLQKFAERYLSCEA
jgi:hypothetical protein